MQSYVQYCINHCQYDKIAEIVDKNILYGQYGASNDGAGDEKLSVCSEMVKFAMK